MTKETDQLKAYIATLIDASEGKEISSLPDGVAHHVKPLLTQIKAVVMDNGLTHSDACDMLGLRHMRGIRMDLEYCFNFAVEFAVFESACIENGID